ncbi:MAG: glycogen/starch/alpha-glucan family phosphorylase [Oscillospiraceae bacterium]|jgi:starch phosphorylase|nr:glycogen/starch/alpha-glucan family phosphorylase [Oscillospiraceae bacterium]
MYSKNVLREIDAALAEISPAWNRPFDGKRACYFSAEFLIGRVVTGNFYNLGKTDCLTNLSSELEDVEDVALGNGGLGRLAACFLDSAATKGYPLDGFGLRYHYGLFKQGFNDGFQTESPDDWLKYGDPWSIRREDEKLQIRFGGQTVWAVPYDMPIIGYGGKTVNTLRLWQSEPIIGLEFSAFDRQDYASAFKEQNEAFAISATLYPNDDTDDGKRLRLKQQYFFSSASLRSLFYRHTQSGGKPEDFAEKFAIQLNDTHPTVAIPELLRILVGENEMDFEQAFSVAQKTFAFTNHTIMEEALEKWSTELFSSTLPDVYPYVVMLQNKLRRDLHTKGIYDYNGYNLIDNGRVNMARIASYVSHSVNGVAAIHSEILKATVLKPWYTIYPERFSNKTNGITQRRWLGLCNPGLSKFITERIGGDWITDLDELKKLIPYADDVNSLRQLNEIKRENKVRLADYVRTREDGFTLNPEFAFNLQVKRLHEYKRQFLNALSILDIYYRLKRGEINKSEFSPTAFVFGAKSAPSYRRAKGIIKFVNEIARTVNSDTDVNNLLQILFVRDYNVSYAEKLIPAADISEQISTAGTEASGTGNMKLMLNGAVTLGTYDGANIEIVAESGEENNFIFGARVEDINAAASSYSPVKIYENNSRVRKVLDTLIDGTFSDGGTGIFRELFDSIIKGASWHKPDQYYLLLDFEPYADAKLRAIKAYPDRIAFAHMQLLNIANAGKFSSDRTISQYAEEIWGV